MTQSDHRLITFISWAGIVLGSISMSGYLILGLWLDTAYGSLSVLFFAVILYLINQKRITYNVASLLFSGFGVVLVTVGYITSNSIEDGLIYMIIPTIIIALLRPSREALVWLLCYYTMFFSHQSFGYSKLSYLFQCFHSAFCYSYDFIPDYKLFS